MPFGILECNRMEIVPGTAILRDQNDIPDELAAVPADALKHGTGRFSHVVLVPQPSDSPNDPLNWPTWKKDVILFIVGMNAAIVGAYGPMLGPGFVTISAQLGITVEVLSQATAWLILVLGLCVFIFNPLAKIYGKRPVYVLCSIILVIVSIWGAVADNYRSFLGSRCLGALGMAPYEVLVQATISDLYFVHERATRIAAWNLFLLCGIAGAGLISGYIIEDLGYEWTFGICAILFFIFGIGVLLYVPETSYIRPNIVADMMEQAHGKGDEKAMHIESHREVSQTPVSTSLTGNGTEPNAATESKMSYWKSLRFYTGRYSDAAIWKIFTRPLIMFWYPCVLWGFLVYGTTLTWIVVFSVVNGVIFVSPPYNFSVSQTGLISLSPFILCIIGEAISGPLNDWICLRLAKANRGVYEPEFRLVLMIVVVILGTVGFFGFGASVHYATHWSGPVLTFGFANMALAFASTCVFSYVLDCYPRLAEEAFVAINTRNLLTFGLTYFVNSWLAESGPLVVFNILGACFVAVCALTIPLWIFGKKIRSWVARNNFLNEFMTDQ
ncbi:putative MFS-type transporter [Pseudocercospora fuligena]|uniref:Putative MFS-type transporter n=1 Tax=Pseudocercospora fuligena TaxID=685502 RepID=A0A8H6R7A0_9PEZI|nr:putative MFS-type transporter [Pseudocercospora fuligena]